MRYRVQHVPEEVEAHISGLSGTRARVNGKAQPVVIRVGRRLVVVIPTTRRKQKNNKKEEETREEEDKRGGEKIAK